MSAGGTGGAAVGGGSGVGVLLGRVVLGWIVLGRVAQRLAASAASICDASASGAVTGSLQVKRSHT